MSKYGIDQEDPKRYDLISNVCACTINCGEAVNETIEQSISIYWTSFTHQKKDLRFSLQNVPIDGVKFICSLYWTPFLSGILGGFMSTLWSINGEGVWLSFLSPVHNSSHHKCSLSFICIVEGYSTTVFVFLFFEKCCWTHVHLWSHWYPYLGLLVTSPLDFKVRVGSLIQTL